MKKKKRRKTGCTCKGCGRKLGDPTPAGLLKFMFIDQCVDYPRCRFPGLRCDKKRVKAELPCLEF